MLKYKKFAKSFILTILSIILLLSSGCISEKKISSTQNATQTDTSLIAEASSQPLSTLTAKHCIVIENNSGRVLFEKNAYRKSAMASTTKIMTAMIVLENCDLDEIVTVSSYAAGIGGSTVNLKTGEEISVENLLYGLMLESGNDAATALAEHTADSVAEFCNLMNIKAKSIGAKNTNFTSPHGLDNDNHFTTAYDLAIIAKEALKNETFCEIVGTKTITCGNRFLSNTNNLLGVVDGIDGVKTGFTNNAGRCIVLTAERDGMRIIIVILGCPDNKSRTSDGKKIVDYIYENYKLYNIFTKNYSLGTVYTDKSKTLPSEIYINGDVDFPLTEDEYSGLTCEAEIFGNKYKYSNGFNLNIKSKKNLKSKSQIGKVYIYSEDTVITEVPVIVKNDVTRKSFKDYWNETVNSWIWLLTEQNTVIFSQITDKIRLFSKILLVRKVLY